MQISYNAFCLLVFSGQFYEKWVLDWESSIKLLLETVTYLATTVHNYNSRNSHVYHAETPTCIISVKFVTNIFAAEIFICINAAETSNYIIATETFTCVIATKRSTNIIVVESTTNIFAIEPQKLHNCNRSWHLHNCYRK